MIVINKNTSLSLIKNYVIVTSFLCHSWGLRTQGGGEHVKIPYTFHAASTRRDKNTRLAWGRHRSEGLTLLVLHSKIKYFERSSDIQGKQNSWQAKHFSSYIPLEYHQIHELRGPHALEYHQIHELRGPPALEYHQIHELRGPPAVRPRGAAIKGTTRGGISSSLALFNPRLKLICWINRNTLPPGAT